MINERVADIDKILTDQLNAILHHGDFQALEASWRGLHDMVFGTETGPQLKLRLLNARLSLLSRQFDLAAADLHEAQALIDRWFDRGARRVVVAGETLRQVAAQSRQVVVPRPDATLAAIATLSAVPAPR